MKYVNKKMLKTPRHKVWKSIFYEVKTDIWRYIYMGFFSPTIYQRINDQLRSPQELQLYEDKKLINIHT